MGRITTGVGLISGINSQSIIDQLMQLEAAPVTNLQNRITTANSQKSAYTDLQTQLNALKARVTKLEKRASNLETIIGGCFTTAVPISRYGGYEYKNPDGSEILTSAIDVTNSGGTPGAYALDVGQACANAINGAYGYRKLQLLRLPASAR